MSGVDVDVIIVGAGPSGCAAGFDLARSGRSVLLLDRHLFPRNKACGGALTIKALRGLRYSVKPVIRRIVTRISFDQGPDRHRLLVGNRPVCAMTVRSEFDEYCLHRTLEQGCRFQRVNRLRSIDEKPDRVVLATSEREWTARFLIGADGSDSQVRRLSQASPSAERTALAIETDLPWKHGPLPEMTFDFGAVPRGYGWLFPRDDHLNVGLYSIDRSVRLGRETLGAYLADRWKLAADHPVIGHRIGIGGSHYRPGSRRVLLVGDAAGLAEPMLGEGLSHAILSGQAAAAAIHQDLQGQTQADQAYHRLLGSIQRDLRSLARWSALFYGFPSLGYAIMTAPVVRASLMEGFGRGLSFKAIRRRWWFLGLLSPSAESARGDLAGPDSRLTDSRADGPLPA